MGVEQTLRWTKRWTQPHVRALSEDLAHALIFHEPDNSALKSLMTLKSLKTGRVLYNFLFLIVLEQRNSTTPQWEWSKPYSGPSGAFQLTLKLSSTPLTRSRRRPGARSHLPGA